MSAPGRAWVYGDDINTDLLAPAPYLKGSMEDLASHCLEGLDGDFASSVNEGDVFVAGENLGIGSSREQAPQALQ
ncbi:MAG: 3-isopropylmalate dehydratase, partial [Gammaproteobacteria bacterium]|nr:3-isopropylmalate dehydratase [Gammaproteobacteria bacterium]